MNKYLGVATKEEPGHFMDYMNRNTTNVMVLSRVGMTSALADLFYGLTNGKDAIDISADTDVRVERIFLFCLFWTVGGCLDVPSRHKMDEYIRNIDAKFMPAAEWPRRDYLRVLR